MEAVLFSALAKRPMELACNKSSSGTRSAQKLDLEVVVA